MARVQLIVVGVSALALAGAAAWWLHEQKSPSGADPNDREQVALGETLYRTQCASCHGARLEGQANWRRALPTGGLPAPPHDASGHSWHHPDQNLFDVTKFGGQAKAPPGFRSNMPAFKNSLKDREIWAILAYIKSRWPAEVRQRQAAINDRFEKKK